MTVWFTGRVTNCSVCFAAVRSWTSASDNHPLTRAPRAPLQQRLALQPRQRFMVRNMHITVIFIYLFFLPSIYFVYFSPRIINLRTFLNILKQKKTHFEVYTTESTSKIAIFPWALFPSSPLNPLFSISSSDHALHNFPILRPLPRASPISLFSLLPWHPRTSLRGPLAVSDPEVN